MAFYVDFPREDVCDQGQFSFDVLFVDSVSM